MATPGAPCHTEYIKHISRTSPLSDDVARCQATGQAPHLSTNVYKGNQHCASEKGFPAFLAVTRANIIRLY